MLCSVSFVLAESASVLTQEQYDQVNAWFDQVMETIPGSDNAQTISGNKFIVALKDSGKSICTSLPGDELRLDMSGFPQEHLAATYEEADTLIMIYPVYKVTGQYLGMAIPVSARRTYATVCVVDLVSGTVGAPVSAVVKNAPTTVQIKTQNGIPMQNAISGPFSAQEALEKAVAWLEISDTAEDDPQETIPLPEELLGEWSGTGIPKDNGPQIKLNATIWEDGTGSYTFIQGSYTENYSFTISATDNTFSVDIPETAQLGKVNGTWSLEGGKLLLDITTTFSNGRTYSYTATCSKEATMTPGQEELSALLNSLLKILSNTAQ